jgi:type I restriction enzyme R subunit
MVVSIDKATALKMHDKVRKHWAAERERVEVELAEMARYPVAADVSPLQSHTTDKLEPPHVGCYDAEKMRELQARLDVLKTSDMALIVSPGQNEIAQMQGLGLDIVPHRKRMNAEAMDEKFKDPADPLRLVFLCAMWMTGFDAPSCSTVYLDKPMRNHTLMQTIARANRVFPGKTAA